MYSRRITIDEVIPWGKTFHEYQQYFSLQDTDLNKTIACFGDGASSFNSELTQLGKKLSRLTPFIILALLILKKDFMKRWNNSNYRSILRNLMWIQLYRKLFHQGRQLQKCF